MSSALLSAGPVFGYLRRVRSCPCEDACSIRGGRVPARGGQGGNPVLQSRCSARWTASPRLLSVARDRLRLKKANNHVNVALLADGFVHALEYSRRS